MYFINVRFSLKLSFFNKCSQHERSIIISLYHSDLVLYSMGGRSDITISGIIIIRTEKLSL